MALLLTSWAVTAMMSLNYNYIIKISEPLESFGLLYEKPMPRFGPYVMGERWSRVGPFDVVFEHLSCPPQV